LTPSSGLKSKPDKQQAELCLVLTGWLAYFSILKTEAGYSSETPVISIVHLSLFRSFVSLELLTSTHCSHVDNGRFYAHILKKFQTLYWQILNTNVRPNLLSNIGTQTIVKYEILRNSAP
jgi:hypothetical protein